MKVSKTEDDKIILDGQGDIYIAKPGHSALEVDNHNFYVDVRNWNIYGNATELTYSNLPTFINAKPFVIKTFLFLDKLEKYLTKLFDRAKHYRYDEKSNTIIPDRKIW